MARQGPGREEKATRAPGKASAPRGRGGRAEACREPQKRRYDMCLRAQKVSETRRRLLDAARSCLIEQGALDLSLEAVAKTAGVTRVTVYKHFESKRGLFEALFDELALRGGAAAIARAANDEEDAVAALRRFVVSTCRLWGSDPDLFRRLLALGDLDPEMGAQLQGREDRRRGSANRVVAALADAGRVPLGWSDAALAEALCALTSFRMFDALTDPETMMLRLCESLVHPGA